MVHALQALYEAWRVLKPNGLMCDIHPISPIMPIEFVTDEERLPVGFLDTLANPSDSMERIIMATNVLAIATHEGRFALEQQELFSTLMYWDTVAEMDNYYGEVSTDMRLPDAVRQRAVEMMRAAGDAAQLSVHRTLSIGRYRKMGN